MAGIQSELSKFHQSPSKQTNADQIAGAPRPGLCITEKWIRRRLNLQLNTLGKSCLAGHCTIIDY